MTDPITTRLDDIAADLALTDGSQWRHSSETAAARERLADAAPELHAVVTELLTLADDADQSFYPCIPGSGNGVPATVVRAAAARHLTSLLDDPALAADAEHPRNSDLDVPTGPELIDHVDDIQAHTAADEQGRSGPS